jgi:hypothetical protein
MATRSSQLLTEEELVPWIKRRLGAPVLKVVLENEHFHDAVEEAKRWFAAKKGVDREVVIDMVGGQVEYPMPDDCDAVYDVSFSVNPLDISLIFAPHIFADEKIPYNTFAAPSSVGLYSSLVQALQYVDMAKRILNADTNFIYFTHKNTIFLLPDHRSGGGGGKALVEYKSSCTTLQLLPERDHDMVKRYALAHAMQDLGMILSRYDAMPSAQGSVRLNGPELLAKSDKMFEALDEELANSAFPMPFVTG